MDLKDLRIEAARLRDELKVLNDEREKRFLERKTYSDNIKALIATLKDSKQSRDGLTTTIKDVKKQRDQLNAEVKDLIAQIKVLQPQGPQETQERVNVGGIRAQINKLEYSIETEGLSFAQETRVMKQINQLKKQLGGAEESSEQGKKVKEISKIINQKKKDAKRLHQMIRENADSSQKHHEHLIANSKEIDELKEKEKQAHEAFIAVKEKCADVAKRMRELRKEIKDVSDVEHSRREAQDEEHKRNRESKMQKDLDRMVREVEDKITRGDKLTTEDLLVMQRSSRDHD